MAMQDQLNATPKSRRVPWNKGKLTGAKAAAATQTRVVDPSTASFVAVMSSRSGWRMSLPGDTRRIAQRSGKKKTGRPVRFELGEQTRQAVDDYLKVSGKRPGEFLFTGRRGPESSMTTRQYARLVSEWIGSVGLDPRLFATHSLRRTKATLIYRRTGNLRAVQLLLGHTKIESTVRYLGIEVDDALAIAEQVDV